MKKVRQSIAASGQTSGTCYSSSVVAVVVDVDIRRFLPLLCFNYEFSGLGMWYFSYG